MPIDRRGIRGVVLTEDRRTERFIRHLLVALGYEKRNFRFLTAPAGGGAGEAWVREQYPGEVNVLRSRSFQSLCMVAVRDGDNVGVAGRKRELDAALTAAGYAPRSATEPIATPVPTWSIESWLLDLLGHAAIDELQCAADGTPWKRVYERENSHDEKEALRRATTAWGHHPTTGRAALPSLSDGHAELDRIG